MESIHAIQKIWYIQLVEQREQNMVLHVDKGKEETYDKTKNRY